MAISIKLADVQRADPIAAGAWYFQGGIRRNAKH